jgi:hypothetical protein
LQRCPARRETSDEPLAMSYVIVLTAMTLGIAGVLFTRRTQFNLLTTASQALIWLIVIIGIVGIVDIAYKDDAIRQAERRVQLGEAKLQSLALKPFDLAKPPTAAKFLIEAEEGGQPLKIANFAGPFPNYGRTGRLGRISVALPNVFALHADVLVEDGDSIRFTQTEADGRPVREGDQGPWFRPGGNLPFAHGADLKPQLALAKLLAALKANGQQPLATMEFDIPNKAQTRTFVTLNLERIFPSFRFYLRQETPFEPCATVVNVPMRFELDPPQSETRMHFTLRLIEREMLSVECEKLPF